MDTVGAIVLAGGQSSRFGSDKALAQFGGRCLVEHVVRALPVERAETLLVQRESQARPSSEFDRVIFDDPDLPDGPLRGIISGLEASNAEWSWVVACDLPGISPVLLELLVQRRTEESLAVIPEWQERLQPLCALYSRSAAAVLRAAIANGERSAQGALADPRFLRLTTDQVRQVDPSGRSFININTPDALERFRSAS